MGLDLTDKEKRLLDIVKGIAPPLVRALEDPDVRAVYFGLAARVDPKIARPRHGQRTKSWKNLDYYISAEASTLDGLILAVENIDYLLRPSEDMSEKTKRFAKDEIRNVVQKQRGKEAAPILLTPYSRIPLKERSGRWDYMIGKENALVVLPSPFGKSAAAAIELDWNFDDFLFYYFSQSIMVMKAFSEGANVEKMIDKEIVPKFKQYVDRLNKKTNK